MPAYNMFWYNKTMPNDRRLFIPNSYLFITIVTNKRQPILIDNVDLLRKSFKAAKEVYNFEIFASVILPDYIHLIIIPKNINDYPKIIRAIKYNFSKMINDGGIAIPPYKNDNCSAGLPSCQNKTIWQRRYWEHTIRAEEDLNKHLDYIHYNPIKHGLTQKVKDWEFSSFNKFVESKNYDINWGSVGDVKHIATMEYD